MLGLYNIIVGLTLLKKIKMLFLIIIKKIIEIVIILS
jgi:hypothetical protein